MNIYRPPYPAIDPYRTGVLKVSDLHDIYFEECGNPDGVPALMVHGGPGGGANAFMRRLHDPAYYRIILFDQRGCGRSSPHAELRDNTTWHLVDDMEALRKHLHVERWQLLGGSWGSTLSLAYAERHPERVSQIILRGVFTMRRAEIDWFYQSGCNWIFPDSWEKFVEPIPVDERGDIIAAYHRRLTGPDEEVAITCAKAWSQWEGSAISLIPDGNRVARFANTRFATAFARIECHYFVNGGFLESDDQLLREAVKLNGIPGRAVHGRYDVVTPLANAWDLVARWPDCELKIVADAGHTMTEPGIVHELVDATDGFR